MLEHFFYSFKKKKKLLKAAVLWGIIPILHVFHLRKRSKTSFEWNVFI